VPVSQDLEGAGNFFFPLLSAPVQSVAKRSGNLTDGCVRQASKHRQHGTAQQQIIQVNNFFALAKERDLALTVGWETLESLVRSTANESTNKLSARPVPLE
jgi:hypothetical protein